MRIPVLIPHETDLNPNLTGKDIKDIISWWKEIIEQNRPNNYKYVWPNMRTPVAGTVT